MNVTKKNVKTRQGFVTGDMHGEAVGGGGTGRRGPCVLQGENLIYQNLTILTYQNNSNLEFNIQKLQSFRNMNKFSKL